MTQPEPKPEPKLKSKEELIILLSQAKYFSRVAVDYGGTYQNTLKCLEAAVIVDAKSAVSDILSKCRCA
jgi:hypothetical protein